MTLKNLEAKVKIKRLCGNITDLTERKTVEREIELIYNSLVFSSDVEKNDFKEFIKNVLNNKVIQVEPEDSDEETETNSDETDSEDDNDEVDSEDEIEKKDDSWNNWKSNENELIKPLNDERAKTQGIKDEMHRLKKQKETLLLFKKRKKLKEEVDKLQKEMQDDLKEESYLTDKKDKDGIIVLRKEKYETEMGLAKLENDSAIISLAEAEEKGNEEEIRSAKDRVKKSYERINYLRKIKFQTKVGNFMTKFPRYINKGSGFIREISDGLGSIGGEYSQFETRSKEKISDMGFNEKSMFDQGDYFGNVKEKKKTVKRKKSKKRRKKAEADNEFW